MDALQAKVTELATKLEVPGVAVGVVLDGQESYAFHGVTSLDNPLPVDETTLFQFGSTGKTFTATAMMRLVEQGKVSLDAPVRTYVPELKLKDDDVAQRVTVLQLFNHTAGWEGDMMDSTGEGDDALAQYVARMERLEQATPLGSTVSYNNASLSLAGRVIEKVTGLTFEQAIHDLVLAPLGLDHTFFFMNDIMTRRFVVGHTRHEDGTITVARPWGLPRGGAPAGGMTATARDQVAWARFHLGDGTAADGTRVLETATLRKMQEPTFDMRGSALGDYVGISWLMKDVDGARIVGHGGSMIGQYSEFTMVPARGFAITSLTNCGPNGSTFNSEIERWALKHFLGIDATEAESIEVGEERLAEYTGRYETIAATVEITAGAGRLVAQVEMKPETIAALTDAGGEAPETQPPFVFGLLSADSDQYVVAEGPAKGMKGFFSRGADGRVDGVHVGGRLATRTSVPVE